MKFSPFDTVKVNLWRAGFCVIFFRTYRVATGFTVFLLKGNILHQKESTPCHALKTV